MNQQNIDKEKQNALFTISALLTDICDQSTENKDMNESIITIPYNSFPLTENIKCFISKRIPEIEIKKYLERLVKYTNLETSTMILILIFIDRLCEKNHIRLNYFNIHKLIIASMIISIKYNEDEFYENDFYAKVGGIPKSDVDLMEYEFLTLIEFTLYVSDELYQKYQNHIQSMIVN